MQNFTFELDIIKKRTVKAGDRIVLGYASTFDIDSDNMQITREALEYAKNDLLKYSTVLFNHRTNRPIGKTVETSVDDVGLLVKVVISKEEDIIWKKIKEDIINKFSIKGRTLEVVPVNGNENICQIKKIELFEVSLVSVPANVGARTISHYVSKSMSKEENSIEASKNKRMDNLIEKLKAIQKTNDEDVKEEIVVLIKELEKERDVIADLQIVAGKLEENDRDAIEAAINLLKERSKKEVVEEFPDNTEKEYSLEDETTERPVFQINMAEEEIDFEEGTTQFKKEILKLGKWFHWDADGGILNVSEEIIDNIIKNFKKKVIENVYVPITHTSDPSKNAGEIVSLKKTESGLDAVIDIKDESVAEKIKKGLIKCVSASLDPNYRVKKTNKFVGPTLLHTALVAEPYIKGMRSFVALSDDLSDRSIIQLEDEKPNFYSALKMIRESLDKIEEKTITEDKLNELFFDMSSDGIKIEEKAKKTPKVGEDCLVDGKKGKYIETDGKITCQILTEKELDEVEKSAYRDCMSKEMKSGKSLLDAVKICKVKVKKELDEKTSEKESEEKSDTESEETTSSKVDLAEVERVYEKYLEQGKVVPAQKEVFIKLLTSRKILKLDESKVDTSKLLEEFMESLPKIIDFDEKGTQGNIEEENKDKKETEEIPTDVKSFYTKMGLSDDAAKESWKYAKSIKEKEDEAKTSTVF